MQRTYEALRRRALSGEEVSAFVQWGMSLLVSGGGRRMEGVWVTRRQRSSVRAGDFSLGELLLQLGITGGHGQRSKSCMDAGKVEVW